MTATAADFATMRIPDLHARSVLITGASTGIGAALALAFARQGATVGVHYNVSEEPARKVAADIEAFGGTCHLIRGDVSEAQACEAIVAEFAARAGRIDGLINNAGGMLGRHTTAEMDEAHYERVMDLNAKSVYLMTRAAVPHLKAAGGGFVINTTSIAARNGGGNGAILYAASKGFVSTITRGHAKEFVKDNIRVNAVSPGLINTPFQERYTPSELYKTQISSVPMGYAGEPEDCVGTYLFLASPMLSGYITGQVIEVNGGQLMP